MWIDVQDILYMNPHLISSDVFLSVLMCNSTLRFNDDSVPKTAENWVAPAHAANNGKITRVTA